MRKIPALVFVLLFSALFCSAQSIYYNVKKVDWAFSESDFNLNLSEEKIDVGSHKFQFSRQTANETELLLIRKAEALYPKETTPENTGTVNKSGKVFEPEIETPPVWSTRPFDGVKIAKLISTRAIDYYRQLSSAYRNKHNPTRIQMKETDFRYWANVVHFDKYDIKREIFKDVYVVFMKMKWSQYCGGLCAMAFTREKFVIFDKNNEPVAMFIDTDQGAVVS